MSLGNALSILFIFSKHHLLALLIFAMVSLVSFAFISALIFKISFLLLTLGFFIMSAFLYTVWVCHSFPSKEEASFNFKAALTVCSDFGDQENKICHCLPIQLISKAIRPKKSL